MCDDVIQFIKKLNIDKPILYGFSDGGIIGILVAIKEYIKRNNPTYYPKPDRETITYRNLMLRKDNIKKMNEYNKKTGISFTRLVNGAIKEFFEK